MSILRYRWTRSLLTSALIIGAIVGNAKAETETAAVEAIFPPTQAPEQGWKGLARVLDALTPSADTSLPLSASEITTRISSLIDQGSTEAALDAIARREQQRQQEGAIGVDVQLQFLKARALSAANRHDEAIESYRELTIAYPELPEPWNNLAAEHSRLQQYALAEEALTMALTANPNFRLAQANLGEVRLQLAAEAFEAAGQYGAERSKQLQSLLQP